MKLNSIRDQCAAFIWLFVMGCLFMALPASAITVDGAVSSNTADDVSTINVNHTSGTGTNRLMLVGVSWNCGTTNQTISSVTFTPDEGIAVGLTEVITQLGYNTTNPRYSAIYSLLNPPSGQTGTVTVAFSGAVSNGIMAGVANFAGVHQTTPLGTASGANGNSKAPSVTLSGLNGDELVFDNVFLGAGSASYTLTVGSGQTQLWNPTFVANLRAAASTEQATSSSVTMSWTASTGNYWAIAAVPINPAGPAGPTITITGTPLDAFISLPNLPSAAQTYSVSGSNLTADIIITPPTDFEISLNGSDWTTSSSNLTLTQSGGTVAATTIYARLNRTTAGSSSGNITHTSSGATQQDVAVSGTAATIFVDGAVSSSTGAANATSLSFSHTTGTSIYRLTLVGVSWNCGSTDRTISSITFTPGGGSAITLQEVITEKHNESGKPRYSAIYSLLNPASGVTGTVAISFSGAVSNGIVGGAVNFAGVDQTTPLGPTAGAQGNSTDVSMDLTGLDGDELVFDNVFKGATNESSTLTAGAGQTQLWNMWVSNTRAAASTEAAGGSSVTMSWTGSETALWAITAVAINPTEDPIAINLTSFQARQMNDGTVAVDWVTAAEVKTAGFFIQRSESADNGFRRIHDQIIPAKGNNSAGAVYQFIDTNRPTQSYYYRLEEVSLDGESIFHQPIALATISAAENEVHAPLAFALSQNYPNPFNPVTRIDYTLPQSEQVTLNIYDLNGRLVKQLVNERQKEGHYSMTWDGTDEQGLRVVSGTYLYRLSAGEEIAVHKMVLLK